MMNIFGRRPSAKQKIEMKVKGKINIMVEIQLDRYMRLLGKKRGFIINIGLTDYEIKEVCK